MPTDYNKLREENIGRYGSETAHLAILGELYAERTHFIFELLQNSEDAKAKHVHFKLEPEGLQLLHDGRSFDAADVRAVCSVCQSTSQGDSDRIGRFGIGFKSVYCYTATPEIHSGDEHFVIEHYVRPKAVVHREIAMGHSTLIALPFPSPSVTSETAFQEIASAFQALDQSALLFLRHVESLEVKVEAEDNIFLGRRIISRPEKWVRIVSLVSDDDSSSEQRWLVTERSCQLTGTTGKPVNAHVEIAFALAPAERGSEITVENHDGATLAVFFPTDKPTHTGFILQGPYRTTPARDNILVNDPINEHLVQKTCELLVATLCWLRDQDNLTTEVFHTLPLSRADFPEGSMLQPLFAHVLDALTKQPLLPAYADAPDDPKFICGNQAVAASDPELRELLTNDELKEALGGDTDWRWLAEDMSLDGDGALAVYLRDEIKIQEFTAEDFVSWLETKDADWWKDLDESCLLSAYRYFLSAFDSQPAEYKRLRKLPLVRLESGEHVSPDDQAVFFPADNINEKKELTPFLAQLPIIRLSLLDDDEDKIIESFLLKIGVSRLVACEFIKHYFIPKYQGKNDTTEEEDLALGRYLFRAFQRMSDHERDEAAQKLSQIEWLLCRKASQPDTLFLEKSENAYLGQSYTESSDLEDYFSASPETCFVHEDYHQDSENWLSFLGKMGCSDIPRRSSDKHKMEGLDEALAALRAKTEIGERIKLANSILSVISAHVPEDERERDPCFQVSERIYGPRGGYHCSREADAKFWITLKQASWLPDSSGNLRKPNALFQDNQQNRRLLGDTVFYLHADIALEKEKAKWLATKMGIRSAPNKEAVLTCLKKMRQTDAVLTGVLPLYEFLSRTVGSDDADVFEKGELIFCPDTNLKWRPPSEVFWSDESSVFGSTRAYLKSHYPSLQDFFSKVGVQTSANPSDYAEALLEIAESSTADDASRHRIHRIYKRLALLLDEGGDWQEDEYWEKTWDELQAGRCWLGRKGDDFGFYQLRELVVVDNEHLENLFHGKVAFWPFKDLNDFAKKHLEIEPCSTAEKEFQAGNKGEQQGALSEQLAAAWPSIGDFLQSDKWKGDVLEARDFTDTSPLIWAAEKIGVTYILKEIEAEEPDGKAAFFDSKENTIWLVPNEAREGEEHFEALSEALQEYFGPEALREFCHDLFRKGIEKAEVKWRKRGLMARLDVSPESEPAEPLPNTSLENFNEVSASAEREEGVTDKPEDATKSRGAAPSPDTHSNHPPTDTERVEPAPFRDRLKEALNKPGKAAELPQAPERAAVTNAERRRKQTVKEIAAAREKEPTQSERQKTLPRTVWESKDPGVRSKLKQWYGGQCQICRDTFRKRDGDNYFEACYLVPRTVEGAAWLDRVGNVLCLCADCSAKFQFGPIESASDIQKKIADLKLVGEGGTQPHSVSISLCGEDVAINFDERHLIDLQSMLKSDQARFVSEGSTASPDKAESGMLHLVQCPHCPSKVRADRMDRHLRDVHRPQRLTSLKDTQSLVQARRCKKGCGRVTLPGIDYCRRCI